MKPTIKDIAKMAGVTHPTVSRALNNEAGVSEEMRGKIAAIAKQLGYVPNIAARRLMDRSTNCIGLIWPHGESLFYYHLCNEIHRMAAERDYHTMISLAAPELAVKLFEEHFIDRILMWATPAWTPSADFVRTMETFQGSALIIGGGAFKGSHRIAIDRSQGIYDAVRYLAGLGHKRVTFVGHNRDKQLGFTKAIVELQMEYHPDYIISTRDRGEFEAHMIALLRREPERRATAVIAENHSMAERIVQSFRKHNVRVPQDISMIVYDDIPEMERMMDIRFTAIGPNMRELAERSLDILSEAKRGDRLENVIVCPELVVRESTAEPAFG